jgi:DNA polymerase-4
MGIDDRNVEVGRRCKSLSVENTFSHDLKNMQQCLSELPLVAQQLVTGLKRVDDDYKLVKLFVKIKFADFTAAIIECSAGSV